MKYGLLFVFVLVITPVILFSQTATQPSVGDGTSGNPYQIATLDNLYWLTQTTSAWASGKYFKQTTNIDASSTSGWASGAGFSPIGNDAIYFQGTYNGSGHIITNLYINRPSTDYIGLFGEVQYGTIESLGVANVNITGGNYYVGALVGDFARDGAKINFCYSSGIIHSHSRTGGLVGEKISGSPTISNCYSSVSVNADGQYVGGLVGTHISGTLDNCYSAGSVSGGSSVGGLIGANFATINNSFWDTQTSGQSSSGGGTGKTTTEMKMSSTFTGWDQTGTIWKIDGSINSGYPFLAWQNIGGSALPVELTSFMASTNASSVTLSWSTATEVNNFGFEVERRAVNGESLTMNSWQKIGFVKGTGTSNVQKEYSYSDASTSSGGYVYRLKQIDVDGLFKYSQSVEVNIQTPQQFGLDQNYPNPFNPTTTISYQLPENGHVTLKVYSMLGQEVATLVNETKNAGSYTAQFNASQFSSGIYFFKLTMNQFSSIRKMTLMK
jgi:hypothetical protein